MRNILRIGTLSLLGACGFASQVLAADLPSRVSTPVAPAPMAVAPVFTWTSFYAGINGGYGWGGLPDRLLFGVPAPGVSLKKTAGVMFGGQVGYNYQFGSWVVGAEADLDKLTGGRKAKKNETGSSETYDREYMTTARARLGYAFDRLLVFGTAGIALEKTSVTLANPNSGSWSTSSWNKGFVVGAGVEYAFTDNITAKGEYLYTKFGKQTYKMEGEKIGLPGRSGSVVRAGLNYKF